MQVTCFTTKKACRPEVKEAASVGCVSRTMSQDTVLRKLLNINPDFADGYLQVHFNVLCQVVSEVVHACL